MEFFLFFQTDIKIVWVRNQHRPPKCFILTMSMIDVSNTQLYFTRLPSIIHELTPPLPVELCWIPLPLTIQ